MAELWGTGVRGSCTDQHKWYQQPASGPSVLGEKERGELRKMTLLNVLWRVVDFGNVKIHEFSWCFKLYLFLFVFFPNRVPKVPAESPASLVPLEFVASWVTG